MLLVLGCLLWIVMIAGAVPRAGHDSIELVVPFWDARLASMISAVLEAMMGLTLLRSVLIEVGLSDSLPDAGVAKSIAGAWLALEGMIRLVVATAAGSSAAALPVLVVWRGVAAVVGRFRRDKSRGRAT